MKKIQFFIFPSGSKQEKIILLIKKIRHINKFEGRKAIINRFFIFCKEIFRKKKGNLYNYSPPLYVLSEDFYSLPFEIQKEKCIFELNNMDFDAPLVSIIIPVFNHLEETIKCLYSVVNSNDKIKYEIIIADDHSYDETQQFFELCPKIKYVRNDNNLGFLKNCNNAAKFSNAEFITFLNNDVIVNNGWLENHIRTFALSTQYGLVGSKLLFPDGRLQEAGGIIWDDGSGLNYGRFDDSMNPKYNYSRKVDYCSGACITIRKQIWNDLNGFDELFVPAYYEDTDLAFRIRNRGYQVIYQPLSQVFHIEGSTSGTDINQGIKQYQELNRLKFVKKWKMDLQEHGKISNEDNFYRDRYSPRKILFIDSTTPTPNQDSGSIDAVNLMKMFIELGFNVEFIPDNLSYSGKYTEDLQRIGVYCHYLPFTKSLENHVKKIGNFIDIIILSRISIASKYFETVKKHAPQAKVIFNTVDLHFLREERLSKLTNSIEKSNLAKQIRDQELRMMRKSDQTILVSSYEKEVIENIDPDIKATVLPMSRVFTGVKRGFEFRKDILFIGGFRHLPNIDAVYYFAEEIWPLLTNKIPNCRFLIAGSNMTLKMEKLSKIDGIEILGFVENIDALYERIKLSVAPLRYGAGVKGKVVTSLGFGVPCIMTSIAAEGIGIVDGTHAIIKDNPEEFALEVVKVYNNINYWNDLSLNGFNLVSSKFSYKQVKTDLIKLLKKMNIKTTYL